MKKEYPGINIDEKYLWHAHVKNGKKECMCRYKTSCCGSMAMDILCDEYRYFSPIMCGEKCKKG